MQILGRFFDLKRYEANLTMLRQLSVARLVDSLALALPFNAVEKQLLLETVEPEQRLTNFISLIDGDLDVPDSVTCH